MRKWVFAFAIVAAALSVPFGKTTVGAQAPDAYGWWWQLREPAVPVDPRPLSPVPIPSVTVPTPAGVPEDGLYVEGAATEPQAIGALTFAIAEGTTATKLVLKAAVPLTPTTEILLCPTNNSWQPAAGGRWASRPLWTCAANAPKGVVPADGATLTFTLGDLGKSQLIDVALVPAPTSAFRAIFNKPDKDALTVVGGGTPDVAETAGSGGAVLGTGDLPGTLSGAFNDASFAPALSPLLSSPDATAAIGHAPVVDFGNNTGTAARPVVATAPGQDTMGRLAIFGLLGVAVMFNRLRSQPQRAPQSLVNFGKNRVEE